MKEDDVILATANETDATSLDAATQGIVEALLFAAGKPMTVKQIQQVFPLDEQPPLSVIKLAIDAIMLEYDARPVHLKQLASGYTFQVQAVYAPWVARLFEEKPPKYSRALLETLAIIAYRQPVTRGDIEDIRGVSVSSQIIRTLLDREWIKVVARKEVPGRPALYGTNKQFLDYFNLTSLQDLPTLDEIQTMDFSTQEVESLTSDSNNISEEQPSEQQQTINPLISTIRH